MLRNKLGMIAYGVATIAFSVSCVCRFQTGGDGTFEAILASFNFMMSLYYAHQI
jgi:hypothetical protein